MKTKIFTSFVLVSTLLFSSCSKDEDQSIQLQNQSPIVLKYEQMATIDAVSTEPISYNSENEFHAKVSSNGVITAEHVGKTKINLTNGFDSKSIQVTVEPKYNLYETPNIEWGTTKSKIKTQYGTPDNEDADGFGYLNYSSSAPIAMFLFNSNDQLESCAIMVKMVYASTLTNFLLERYLPINVDTKDYTATFINNLTTAEKITSIGLLAYNLNYLEVIYFDASNIFNQTKSTSKTFINRYRNIAEKLISSQE